MTNEEYLEYMTKPLTDNEKQIIIDAGWKFLNKRLLRSEELL